METYRRRVEAFGCRALVIDGHNLEEIDGAYVDARETVGRPRDPGQDDQGKGSRRSRTRRVHGVALAPDMAVRAIAQLGELHDLRMRCASPNGARPRSGPGGRGHAPQLRSGDKSRPARPTGTGWCTRRPPEWSPWTPR